MNKIIVLCIVFISVFSLMACSMNQEDEQVSKKDTLEKWESRNQFVRDGKVLLTVYPDPVLSAEHPFGAVLHFTEPFEAFEGKQLSIYAYHKQTSEKITVQTPETINEATPGYTSLGRYTVTSVLPESGIWRYEVFLDQSYYADFVLHVKE
ncbi:hypothetical protein ACNRWW_04835 [Metabacillus sp. HB246100]|uniref:hypothetical protein n=1 Tax=Bacillus weihaiensis TaxID=1547283 RepID=UPI002353C0C0|nr:hypothetical protein [Bacillus weihaiensis]